MGQARCSWRSGCARGFAPGGAFRGGGDGDGSAFVLQGLLAGAEEGHAGAWIALAATRRPVSCEQVRDVRHAPEQPHGLLGKKEEAFAFVEAASGVVLGFDDDGEGRDLVVESAEEGVGEECRPSP